jgi:hypothetical protein
VAVTEVSSSSIRCGGTADARLGGILDAQCSLTVQNGLLEYISHVASQRRGVWGQAQRTARPVKGARARTASDLAVESAEAGVAGRLASERQSFGIGQRKAIRNLFPHFERQTQQMLLGSINRFGLHSPAQVCHNAADLTDVAQNACRPFSAAATDSVLALDARSWSLSYGHGP